MLESSWQNEFTPDQKVWLDVLWGKSDVGGEVHLLIQHLLDSMAVGEVMWDCFIARSLRERLDGIAGPSRGRGLFAWICGVHDIGKATPVFQKCSGTLGDRVNAAGLPVDPTISVGGWRHDVAGGSHAFTELPNHFGVEMRDEATQWLWPLIAGHHGRVPESRDVRPTGSAKLGTKAKHGMDPRWISLRTALMSAIAVAAGCNSLLDIRPTGAPSRGDQLAISGLMIMADWIASSSQFSAVSKWSGVSATAARSRANSAWENLGLDGGWRYLPNPPSRIIESRFEVHPREIQTLGVDIARRMDSPGLVIVEAPMGEGKTELALGVSEVLASRFGCSGIAVAMPTQATCDAMFGRVQQWLEGLGGNSQLALLHGKRLVNDNWIQLVEQLQLKPSQSSVDEFGQPDEYGVVTSVCEDCEANNNDETSVHAAAEWFLGRYRGLLAPNFVGTIDQLLFAATRTKFVSLRFSGLAGKVVVIDEVHAADSYMTEFLDELLKWLGSAQVPVVLLSATLSPAQRENLVLSYLGATSTTALDSESAKALTQRAGYPQVTVATRTETAENPDRVAIQTYACEATRPTQQVKLHLIPGFDGDADDELIKALDHELRHGGIALVIRNTVKRAQILFEQLFDLYGGDVRLLHSRFTAGHRAEDTSEIVRLIGPPGMDSGDESSGSGRPQRLIVVATQVAEQSFDVDADVLFTDLAPIDLVLQRIGRLHRHDRARPDHVSEPAAYITAMPPNDPTTKPNDSILTEPGGAAVYGEHHLLRAATLLIDRRNDGISIPADIPRMVDSAYGSSPPILSAWAEAEQVGAAKQTQDERKSVGIAKECRLAPRDSIRTRTLEGLHVRANLKTDVETHIRVRNSDRDSLDVALLRRSDCGFMSIDGVRLGVNGEVAKDDPALVISSLVRVPDIGHGQLHQELRESSQFLGEWSDHPWLRQILAVVIDDTNSVQLSHFYLSYDRKLGLSIQHGKA